MNAIADDVWQVTGSDLRMPGGVRMPVSSTVIQLPDRGLLIYSPIELSDTAAAEIDRLGPVTHIIVPSLFHHLFAAAAAARWPSAVVHAPPGIAAKQATLAVGRTLGAPAPEWGDALDVELIGGAPRANEAVLFHRPTGTLVCADLLFNVTQPANLRTRLALAMMGAGGGKLGQSRLWRMMRKDRLAARASKERILGWPITRVAPCHGPAAVIDASELATRMTRFD